MRQYCVRDDLIIRFKVTSGCTKQDDLWNAPFLSDSVMLIVRPAPLQLAEQISS